MGMVTNLAIQKENAQPRVLSVRNVRRQTVLPTVVKVVNGMSRKLLTRLQAILAPNLLILTV